MRCGTALLISTGSKARASLSSSIRRIIWLSESDRGFQSCYECSPTHMRSGIKKLPTSVPGVATPSHSKAHACDPDAVDKLMQRMRAANASFDLL